MALTPTTQATTLAPLAAIVVEGLRQRPDLAPQIDAAVALLRAGAVERCELDADGATVWFVNPHNPALGFAAWVAPDGRVRDCRRCWPSYPMPRGRWCPHTVAARLLHVAAQRLEQNRAGAA